MKSTTTTTTKIILSLLVLIHISLIVYDNNVVVVADDIKVVSSKIVRKSTNVMSAEMDFALMDITFDRPLYTYMNVICPNFTCANVVTNSQQDCTCDYTDPLACPKTAATTGCPPCPTFYDETDENGVIINTIPYCDFDNSPWTTIQANTQYQFGETSEPIKLRLKSDATMCQGLRLYGSQLTGSFYIYVSTNPSEVLGRRTSGDLSLIPVQIGICPSDNTDWAPMHSWTNNTYFITLAPVTPVASFGLIVYSSNISAVVPPAVPCQNIANVSSTHTCINDGEALYGEGQSEIPTFYTFTVDRPMVLSLGCPLLFEDIDFFISDTAENPYPNATRFKWSAMRPYDDYLTLTVGPWDATTPKILYISIIPYYPSKFQCTVTTHTNNTKRAITDNYDLGGTYLSLGTSRLLLKDGTYVAPDIWQDTNRFYTLFPRLNNNPLWPIPNILFDSSERFSFFSDIIFSDPTNPPLANTYQAAFILSIDRKSTTVFSDYDSITQSKLEFLDILVDIDGNPVQGTLGFEPVLLTCNYTDFQSTLAMINSLENQLFATSEFQNVTSLRFNIDVLTMRDSWAGCSAQANSLLRTQTVEKRLNTTRCPYSSDDPRYADEPCCNSTTTFFQCCVPRELSVETTVNIGVYNDLVSSTCSSYDCTVSLLNDYYTSMSQVEEGSCALTFDNFFDFQLDIYTTLRDCKKIYNPIPCNDNSTCDGHVCNLYYRYCETPVEVQDKQYIQCVLNGSSATILYYLQYTLNISSSPNETSFVDQVYNSFLFDDCAHRTGLAFRMHYIYYNFDPRTDKCYPSPYCLDSTCLTVHDVCYDGYFSGWDLYGVRTTETTCANNGYCSDMSCEDATQACKDQCANQPDFCGYCTNNETQCHKFSTLTSSTCASTANVCLMEDGDYQIASNCANIGTCSSYCGYQCRTNSSIGPSCIYTPALSQSACSSVANSTWNSVFGVCKISVPQTTCVSRPNHKWIDCSLNPVSECYSPYGSDTLKNNICYLAGVECTTKEACEASGSCSDVYFFQQSQTPFYTNGLGKCVHGHFAYKSNWAIPTCLDETENDSPKGCFLTEPIVYTGATCRNLGPEYSWWAPAITKDQCISQMGCKILDQAQQNLPNNYRFNEMNETLCNACGNDISHQWTNMFDWVPGVWTPSIPVKPQWITPNFRHSSQMQSVLDFEAFATELNYGYYTHVSDLLRSASLCRMERVEENLKSISCSCSGPGGSQCFTTSALMLGETKPCANEHSSFSFSYGMLNFDKTSVPYACTSVLVSQVSRQLFRATEVQTLSSNFVSYRKPDDFALLNSRGAIIGTILSDGVKIQAQGVNSYTLCFTSSTGYSGYVLDFVIEEEDALLPMEANISSIVDSTDNVTYHCAFIPNVRATATYLLVARIGDYQDKQKQVFDKGATGLIYTLAVIFLLNSIWGIAQLAITAYKCTQGLEKIKLVHSLILTVTIFMLIRSIYFFILPSGKLSTSAVADYILVVLPTFIYFTAFTIIIVLWYIIVKSKTQRGFLRRIGLMIGTINAILYILFIIIILVFHYTEKTPTNDCVGRMTVEVNTTTPQRIVSIVYAVVQAVISLVIGAAFVYLGGTLYFMMRFKKVSVENNDHRNQQQKRISVVTLACSVGFILHCVFVLILVGAEPSNIIFSFIGLLVTEVIPVISILYSYNQGSLSGIKQTTKPVNLSYVTDSRESFHTSGANTSSTQSSRYDSSFSSTRG